MIILNFKFRQHFIYIVLIVIVALLIRAGVFLLLFIGFVYFKRFPKTYWIYFLMGAIAVIYVEFSLLALPGVSESPIYVERAKVLEVKKQSLTKQTAKVWTESGCFYLTLQTGAPKLLPGDWIEVNEEVSFVEEPRVFHCFDFNAYLKSNGMGGTIYLDETQVIAHEWSPRQYQRQVADWVKERYPSRTATYLQAWFLGIRDDLDEEVSESYSNLGIIHLFAVSGLHVGLLVGMVGYLFKRLGVISELSDALLMVLLIGFVGLSGASPSIVRAGGMAILMRLNQRLRWKFSSLDVFSIVFMLNFIVFPLQVYQTGFIFSYWLTFCLIVTQSIMKRLKGKLSFALIPLIAQLSVLPIQLFQSYELNVASYLANLCLVPLVSVFLITLLLLVLIIPPLAMLSEGLLAVFEQLVLVSEQILNVRWMTGRLSLTIVVCVIGGLLLVGWLLERPKGRHQALLVLIVIGVSLESVRFFNHPSQVTFLDVGQGDSTIIQSPYQSCTTVIDTGGKISFTGEKQPLFERTLEPYLLGEGVREIDYLILTHGDFDHVGEAISLLHQFKVKRLVVPKGSTSDTLKEIIQLANQLGVPVLSPNRGDEVRCGNQVVTFLQSDSVPKDENDGSLVMKVQLDEVNFLFTGDASAQVEAEIMREYPQLKADVYKAAHHGSKTSNSAPFLQQIKPKLTVISSGKNNRYNHPSPEVLETLQQLEIPSLNTQHQGSIQIRIKNKKPSVRSAIHES